MQLAIWSVLLTWLLIGLSPLPTAALSEYQYLEVVKDFADAFLWPNNVEQAASINSTIFSEDVRGTIDVTTNFDGRELSTEYLFGLFVNSADDSKPSTFGIPQSYTITRLLVQHNVVVTGVVFEWHYPILNMTVPVELDAFLTVNEDRQITQYDVVFRRWAWTTDTIIPLLVPHMADYLNISSTNETYVLQQYYAVTTCTGAMAYCNGTNAQYDSYEECTEFLTSIALGQFYRAGENNLICRMVHTAMLSYRPSVHCPHVGPSGGDMCIDRNYTQVVLDNHFPAGFIGPVKATPENADLISNIIGASGTSLDPLLAIVLSGEYLYSWDPTLYATCTFVYFLFLYAVAKIFDFIYLRYVRSYSLLSRQNQKNVVQYTLNTIFTTIALALQLVPTPGFAGRYRLWEIQCMRTAAVLISTLYIFELVYRCTMRPELIAHHVLTIFAIAFSVAAFEYQQSVRYMLSAVIWLFQATTEQPTFIGLIGYRLKWSVPFVTRTLKFAAIQTFFLKSASAIGLLVYWGLYENYHARSFDIAWSVFLWLIAGGLLATQVYGSWNTYQIGVRYEQRLSKLPQSQPARTHSQYSSGSNDDMELQSVQNKNAGEASQSSLGQTEQLLK